MNPRSNLTPYDWACLRVEFMRTRLHIDEWIASLAQLVATFVGFWFVKEHTAGSELLGAIGLFAVLIACGMFKSHVMKSPRAEFAQAEANRAQLSSEPAED